MMLKRLVRRSRTAIPHLPRFSFDRKFLVAWTASLLIVGIVATLNHRTTGTLQRTSARVDAIVQMKATLSTLSTSLVEMESAARGFLINASPDHLQTYARAGRGMAVARLELEASSEEIGLEGLWTAVDAKVKYMDAVLQLAQARPDDAVQMARAGDGRRWMEQVHVITAQVADRLDRDLQTRGAEVATALSYDATVSALLTAILAGLLLTVHLFMVRERQARDALSALQASSHEALEQEVSARTAELSQRTAELHLSENRFRAVFDAVPEAILSVDARQRIVLANPAAARIFGHPSDSLPGRPLDDLIPARHRQSHARSVDAFAQRDGAARPMGRRADVAGLRADGVEFPAEATISANLSGHAPVYTVVLRDITERVNAERALKDSERRLRTVLEALPDAVFVNSQGRVSYVNSGAERMFGAHAADLLGHDALSMFRPDFRAPIQQRIETLLTGGTAAPAARVMVLTQDGRSVEAESSDALIREPEGWAIVVALRDLTQQRAMEGELANSRNRLRLLVNAQVATQETERRRIAMELHDDMQQSMAAIKMDIAAAMKVLSKDVSEAERLLQSAGELGDQVLVSTRRIVNDLRPQMLDDLGLEAALESLAATHSRRTRAQTHVLLDGLLDDTRMPENASISLFRIAQEALNNTAKHALASHVWIRLNVAGNQVQLSVEDDGVGIADGDRSKLNAFGLHGMAERIAALDGKLEILRRDGGGTAVIARIPMLSALGVPG